MRLKRSFQLALNILFHSKLRSWLTIIGIIIGIAAVVAIISISQGAEKQLQERLSGLGANVLTVSPGVQRAFGAEFGGGRVMVSGDGTASSEQKNLTEKDIIAIKSVLNVKYVIGQVSSRNSISYLGKTTNLNVAGVDTSVWKQITTETLSSGRFLSNGDSFSVVIGSNVAQNVFGTQIPLNSKIIIQGKTFNVVGILSEGSSIYMPIDVARTTLNNVGRDEFDSISVQISDVSISNDTVNQITNKLMLSRGILNDKKRDFSVSNPAAMQQSFQQTMNTMSIFLAAIAAISLLVGAIGIANTMFTSVLEKTKDIGIMKAIGAKNRDVLGIFLINSGLIGLVGGIGGVILGAISSTLISNLASEGSASVGAGMNNLFSSSYVSPQIIIGALIFSILIGMIAGVIPAYRASKLNPVDALRYE